MRRGSIAAVVVLLMSVQTFGAVALCLLPCCAPVAQTCHTPQQQTMPAHIGHHAGMHHAKAGAATLNLSLSPSCTRNHASVVASVPRAQVSAGVQACATLASAIAIASAPRATSSRYLEEFSPPIHPNRLPLRI